jgi:DNA-binding GntR family transcriptional regulator
MGWSILIGKSDREDLLEIRTAIELISTLTLTNRCKSSPETRASFLAELEEQIRIMQSSGDSKTDPEFVGTNFDFHAKTIATKQ